MERFEQAPGKVNRAEEAARMLKVDVWFDLICPWCWIGKHMLDQALEHLAQSDPGVEIQTAWHSVQLIPQVPAQGWPFDAFYEHRLGSRDAMMARRAQVQAAARRAGVPIDYTRLSIFPNTAAAHGLLAAGAMQLAPPDFEGLLTRLLEGYFVRGENLGDQAVLAAVVAEYGVRFDMQEAASWNQKEDMPASGVPFFLIDGIEALSGAQPAEVLWAAMRRALARSGSLPAPA